MSVWEEVLERIRRAAEDPKKRRSAVAAASVIGLYLLFSRGGARLQKKNEAAVKAIVERLAFSEFLQLVEKKKVDAVSLGLDVIEFVSDQKRFYTTPVTVHPGLVELLHSKAIPFDELTLPPPRASLGRSLLMLLLPTAYISLCIYVIKLFYDQTSGGDVGKRSSRNTASGPGIKRTTFEDVAGINTAREVVEEVADFLKNPDRYTQIGARLPTGILLIGPPGTGKTMLARAMANESGLPFFYCSGSDFVEIYAGRGAGRVRNLFAKAAKAAPCVVFIDEIDALGKSRSADFSMNEEREQTLNQLLAAMDGFCSEKRIVVMAATNRYDVLDKALVRPGRFDRIVRVELPDQYGREQILKVHSRHMKLAEDCDLPLIASLCPDYTGAELAMICNEAAIRAARDKRQVLLMDDFIVAVQTHKSTTKKGEKTQRSGSDFMNQFFPGVN